MIGTVPRAYVPDRLNACIARLARRFLLPSEFAQEPPRVEYAVPLREAPQGEALAEYAACLSGRQIEDLLLITCCELPESERSSLEAILAARSGKRLVRLAWAVMQYHFSDARMISAAKALIDAAPGLKSPEAEGLRTFVSGDGVKTITDALLSGSGPIGELLGGRRLIDGSPMTDMVLRSFFAQCGADALLMNPLRFRRMLDFDGGDLLSPMISNYLAKLPINAYIADINFYVGEKWGNPFESSSWADVGQPLKRKFSEWAARYRLERHFMTNKKKLDLYFRYVSSLREVDFLHGGSIMVMNFGDFVIADADETSQTSYYISEETYTGIKPRLDAEGAEALLSGVGKMMTARDFMIDEVSPDIMKLDLTDVGKLHVRDALDIILGMSPDLRPSKTLMKNRVRNSAVKRGVRR